MIYETAALASISQQAGAPPSRFPRAWDDQAMAEPIRWAAGSTEFCFHNKKENIND